MSNETSLESSFYEQMAEHVFVSEVLQEAWYGFGRKVAVLRPEVDNEGYDLVLECHGKVRHIQLKTSKINAKRAYQNVNIALANKPSGCIVWMLRHESETTHRMTLTYRFFGDAAGKPLPSLHGFATAKHPRGNSEGVKKERPAIRRVPKGAFSQVENTRALLLRLFGLQGAGG